MPPPRHATPPRPFAAYHPWYLRLLAALILTVLGTGVATAQSEPPRRVAAARTADVRVAHPAPQRVVTITPTVKAKPKPVMRKKAVATKRPVARKPAVRVKRWLPTGTGMWLHEFDQSQGGDGAAIVARAQAVGLTHLFVQTGSSKLGSIADRPLRAILPSSGRAGIKIIAWDFANLARPEADARRLASAALFRCGGCPRVAAVAPDIETAAEGTRINGSNVIRYYNELRKRLPADVAILATVPWPSEVRVGKYPYASTAGRVDAIIPMAYWYNRNPATVTAQSMAFFKKFHKPVMPVGQGYDGRLDAPYLRPDSHPYLSVKSFILTARKWGARSVSLWSWQTTGPNQWKALHSSRKLFAGS